MSQQASAAPEALVGLPPGRIETLVDGIFAVAMTILVLELHVPELGHAPTEARLRDALGHLAPKIACYVSGFVILGTLWVGHHYQFHYIRRSNRALLWINLVFLLAISFLPFVVALIGTYGAMQLPCVVYGATLMVAGSCLLAQWQYAAGAKKRLVGDDLPGEVFIAVRRRVALGMFGYGLGLGVAFASPRSSLVCYGAMPLLYLIPSRIDRYVSVRR